MKNKHTHTPGKLYTLHKNYSFPACFYEDIYNWDGTDTLVIPDYINENSIVMFLETVEFNRWDIHFWHKILWNGRTGHIMAMPYSDKRRLEVMDYRYSSLNETPGYSY
jgi:hypothetical protein